MKLSIAAFAIVTTFATTAYGQHPQWSTIMAQPSNFQATGASLPESYRMRDPGSQLQSPEYQRMVQHNQAALYHR